MTCKNGKVDSAVRRADKNCIACFRDNIIIYINIGIDNVHIYIIIDDAILLCSQTEKPPSSRNLSRTGMPFPLYLYIILCKL